MSEPIAIILKNQMDEIRVTWSEYKGHRYLDIRVYTEIEGKSDKVPTKKGITLRPDLIPELIKGTGEHAMSKPAQTGRRRSRWRGDRGGTRYPSIPCVPARERVLPGHLYGAVIQTAFFS